MTDSTTITTVGQAIKAYKIDTARVLAEGKACARKQGKRWHFVGRGVEVIALDETGERNDDLGGPEFIEAKHLTVKGLLETVEGWRKYRSAGDRHHLAAIHLAGGFDVYDSFADYMDEQKGEGCCDYTIWDDWAGQDISLLLFDGLTCFMCPAVAEFKVHEHLVCGGCAIEVA